MGRHIKFKKEKQGTGTTHNITFAPPQRQRSTGPFIPTFYNTACTMYLCYCQTLLRKEPLSSSLKTKQIKKNKTKQRLSEECNMPLSSTPPKKTLFSQSAPSVHPKKSLSPISSASPSQKLFNPYAPAQPPIPHVLLYHY